MFLDPATGLITECDIIWQARATAWGSSAPNFSTGLIHEIGHFLGLDHTNLHLGAGGFAQLQPTPAFGYPSTVFVNAYGSPFTPDLLPGMVATYSITPINYVLAYIGAYAPPTNAGLIGSMYSDDVAGLAQIYPVATASALKRHLSMDCATVKGVMTNANGPIFGRNVLITQHSPGSTTFPPPAGASVPTNGNISGTARNGSSSVVGLQDSSTVPPTPTSGEFRVEGIQCAAQSPPMQIDVITEQLECLGSGFLPTGAGLGGEWFYEFILNPTANLRPTTTSASAQCGFLSNDSVLPLGSLSIVPGTVLTLPRIVEGQGFVPLNVSRPLVEIVRPMNPFPPPALINVNVHHNSLVGVTVSCNVNGIPITSFLTAVGPAPSSLSTPTAPFMMTIYTFGVPPGAGSSFVVQFTAIEPPAAAGQPPSAQGFSQMKF